MDSKEQRVKDWYIIKKKHNESKKAKGLERKLEEDEVMLLIQKMIQGKVDVMISSFPVDVQDDMRQDINLEIYTALDNLRVIALGIKDANKVIKVSKLKKYFTKDEFDALDQLEVYVNNHLEDKKELDRVLNLLNTKYTQFEFDYIPQTGYSFCINYIKMVCGIYDAKLKGISRGDRDRIKKIKNGTSTDKKQSTKDRLMHLDATSVPESLSVYENYDKDDPGSTMLMPLALRSDSAEDSYWGQANEVRDNFIEEAIRGIENHISSRELTAYEKKREKMVFLWGLYKKLGYDVSLLPEEFTSKAERAEYKAKAPESLIKFTKEWDAKMKSLQLVAAI